jgi:hypothetical protein
VIGVAPCINFAPEPFFHAETHLGPPSVGRKVEDAIRHQLDARHGVFKLAKIVERGSGTVQRAERTMVAAH